MDIATLFDGEKLQSDWDLVNGSLRDEEGLASAIFISLFTDARARVDDALPEDPRVPGTPVADRSPAPFGQRDRRGWWGDMIPPRQSAEGTTHRTGSRLWLLAREKQTAETLRRAEEYAREALQWVIEDGIATAIEVTASAPRPGFCALLIVLDRPKGRQRFEHVWRVHAV